MNARPVVLAAVLLLSACAPRVEVPAVDETTLPSAVDQLPASTPDPVVEQVVATQPLPEAVEAASSVVATPLLQAQAALEDLTPTAPVPEPRDRLCRRAAASLTLRWEVTSPSFYTKRLELPIWPGGSSGVTWGIGDDGGHQTRSVSVADWQTHGQVDRLGGTAGITGRAAQAALPRFRDISTPFDHASQVFEERSLVEYERRTERAFRHGFVDLRPNACAALVSLVYNRGAAMTGDSRREMRNLRDNCVPKQDYACIASELRSMKRLWRGTVNENGLSARREAEAILAETP